MTEDLANLTTEAVESGEVFSVDIERRVVRGLIVPFDKIGTKNGKRFRFTRDSVTWPADLSRVKLFVGHDKANAVGHAFELTPTPEGIVGAFNVVKGVKGDEALTMADGKVWDGLSVGPREGVQLRLAADGVYEFTAYPLLETSLTPAPIFDDARLSSVSMSRTTTTTQEGAVVPEDSTTTEATEAAPEAMTFDVGPITDAIAAGFAALGTNPVVPQRQTVDPSATFEVNEPSPYRFDGAPSAHSFSADMQAIAVNDGEAKARMEKFMQEAWDHQFAVTGANTASLNPTRNRPDLYVPNLTFTRPLWDMVANGVVDDKTPFTIPKFVSATGVVATHVEGVEPTPGAFAATSQTITPSAMSGKMEIVREVWDQGGDPKVDAIIWGEMQNGYFEAIEAGLATTLAAVPTAEVNFASAVDSALVNAVTNLLVDLQFARGGNRFTGLALDGMLGKALINAADTTGRKLLPVLNATNAQGEVSGGFDGVKIGNTTGKFAWALGATNTSKSYLFVPSSVYAWASAPKRFTFEYRVSAVDIAIWGYRASAVIRDSDVKPLDYTTADV